MVQPTRVLLVDDDEEEFIIVRQLLTKGLHSPFELTWVSDFQAAVTALGMDFYDIFLVDYYLGGQTGLDLLAHAKNINCKKPIVVLTNYNNFDLDQRAIQMGAADFLPKRELTPSLLERTIRHALERSQLHESLYYQATHDPLTCLYNRKYILEYLLSTMSGSLRHQVPLSFCLCDVDHFKAINDTYGHVLGDRVLSRLGEIMTANLRKEDIPGRYGGDEFCIVFPHIHHRDALTCVERIRRAFASEAFRDDNGLPIMVSATFGISYLRSEVVAPKQLIEAADKALYEAKMRGRNQTVIYPVLEDAGQIDLKSAALQLRGVSE